MRRLAIPAGIALAFLLLTAGVTLAKDRLAIIHVTQNFDPMTYPGAECVATVATEVIPSKREETITWLIRNGNSENDDDVCPDIVKSMVTLEFQDDVMGMAAMKMLSPSQIMYKGKMVWALVGTVDKGTPKNSTHKYVVKYKGVKASPDPEIEVDCPGCGPGTP